MTNVSEIIKSNKYPEYIVNSKIIKSINCLPKIFTHIGLHNQEESVTIDNSKVTSEIAKQLLTQVIAANLTARVVGLQKFEKKGKMGKNRRDFLANVSAFLTSLSKEIAKNSKSFIQVNSVGKVSLKLANELKLNDKIFRKGQSLFSTYNQVSKLLQENKFAKLRDIEKNPIYSQFSSSNIPNDKLILKFSSYGEDGVWDIATMSMRGISSCQTWNNGMGNSSCVIGSMIDPFTGIIYLTNNAKFNNFGSKMIRRSIVRYIIDKKTKEPALLVERMYPSLDKETFSIFKKFLEDKSKLKVIYFDYKNAYSNYYTPYSRQTEACVKFGAEYLPYRDSGIQFEKDDRFEYLQISSVDDVKKVIISKMSELFRSAIKKDLRLSDLKEFSESAKDIVRHLKGGKKRLNAYGFYETCNDQSVRMVESGKRFADFLFTNTDNVDVMAFAKAIESKILDNKYENMKFIVDDLSSKLLINKNLATMMADTIYKKLMLT